MYRGHERKGHRNDEASCCGGVTKVVAGAEGGVTEMFREILSELSGDLDDN